MPIYTRTGDMGETSLFGGKRVLKCDELVDLYGSIDELNSCLGLVICGLESHEVREFLQKIQADLFTIGSTLAGWSPYAKATGDKTKKGMDVFGSLTERIREMEDRIDEMEKILPALKNFVLPGGTSLAAQAHVLRSICRRVERQTVALIKMNKSQTRLPAMQGTMTNKECEIIIMYLNRLSDLFFVLARFINKQANEKEIIWSGIKK